MAHAVRLRPFVLLTLLLFVVPPLHAIEQVTPERDPGVFEGIWNALVQLLPGIEKLGAGMGPLGVTGPTIPPAHSAGLGEEGELGPGMDPLG